MYKFATTRKKVFKYALGAQINNGRPKPNRTRIPDPSIDLTCESYTCSVTDETLMDDTTRFFLSRKKLNCFVNGHWR